ncbi:hypothetical protein JCM10207_005500 [Rhodosporidiobolus poonsookiae]
MASVGRLLKRDPSLTPLFAAVGCGVCGALAFGAHYLRHSSDVVIKKKENPEPWNKVQQGQNTKLMTRNPDFWASRQSTTDPRAVFSTHDPTEDAMPNPSAAAMAARDRAVKKAKAETMAFFDKRGMVESGQEKRA